VKTIRIYHDGGCSPNPGQKYGSFQILNGKRELFYKTRIPFGFGSNNEAEWESLQFALKTLLSDMALYGADPKKYALYVETDSKIVWYRLAKKNKIHKKPAWRESSERMYNHACACLADLAKFKKFSVEWKRRDANVERFGH